MPGPSVTNLQEVLDDLNEKRRIGDLKGLSEILSKVAKVRAQKEAPQPETDCPDDVEDCSDLVSPCCSVPVSTVFGTLPLKVSCKGCGKEYLLGPLMRELLKRNKPKLPI